MYFQKKLNKHRINKPHLKFKKIYYPLKNILKEIIIKIKKIRVTLPYIMNLNILKNLIYSTIYHNILKKTPKSKYKTTMNKK